MSILQYISDKFKKWNSQGLNIPLANDGTGTPSVTLMFVWVSFISVLASLVYLHIKPDIISPTIMCTVVWSISLVMYKMRMIDKMRFDLKNQEFEIDAEDK